MKRLEGDTLSGKKI